LGLVEAGLGVAAVPSMAMPRRDHPLLVSVPLVEPVVTRKVGLIKRRGRPLPASAQQLYDLFGALKGARRRSSHQPASSFSSASASASAVPLSTRVSPPSK
jgi:DNA-binding transcriptional LysR family regulator